MDTLPVTKVTDMKERYRSGVLKYVLMGYWEPDYEPKDTDVLAVLAASTNICSWRMVMLRMRILQGFPCGCGQSYLLFLKSSSA